QNLEDRIQSYFFTLLHSSRAHAAFVCPNARRSIALDEKYASLPSLGSHRQRSDFRNAIRIAGIDCRRCTGTMATRIVASRRSLCQSRDTVNRRRLVADERSARVEILLALPFARSTRIWRMGGQFSQPYVLLAWRSLSLH